MRNKLIRSNTMQKQGVGTPACLRGQTSLITPCLTYFDPRGKTMVLWLLAVQGKLSCQQPSLLGVLKEHIHVPLS